MQKRRVWLGVANGLLLCGLLTVHPVFGQGWWPFSSKPQATTATSSPAKEKPDSPWSSLWPLTDPTATSSNSSNQPNWAQQAKEGPNGATIRTSEGDLIIELFPNEVPRTVANFKQLVRSGFYTGQGMVFHRVVPGFVVQTGDPTNTGTSGSGKTIPLETSPSLSHTGKGIVAMARSTDPNSATSQFYITLDAQPSLDGKYAVFGRVIQGLEVLDRIDRGDRLLGVTLTDVSTLTPDKGAPPRDTLSYRMMKLVTPKKR